VQQISSLTLTLVVEKFFFAVSEGGVEMEKLTLEELDVLWDEVKRG